MPHAWLFHGQAGVGKRLLGRTLARALLCESPDRPKRLAGGCGACPACTWFDEGNHPDFRRLTSEVIAALEGIASDEESDVGDAEVDAGPAKKAPSKEIKVEQIRGLQRFLAVGTHRGRSRVVLLYPLEALNDFGANALLKMLEEPPPDTVFILVADHVGRVPATIVSRCRKLPIAAPSWDDAIAWLQAQDVDDAASVLALAGGAPFAARELAADADADEAHRALVAFLAAPRLDAALATAEAFGRSPPAPLVRWIQLWLSDCISMRLADRIRYHPAQSRAIAALARAARLDALLALMQTLTAIRRSVDHPLNTRLMLEGLLAAYAEAMTPAR